MNPVLEAIFGNRIIAVALQEQQCYGDDHVLRIAKTSEQEAHRPWLRTSSA